MTTPCPTCQALVADCPDDSSLYSIESSIFPFVFNCPPGYDCGNADGFKMVCCGTLLSVDFPPNATADQKTSLIQGVVNECAALLPACGSNNPKILFYNRDATCTIKCPDGSIFTYTVVAGTFAAATQSDADAEAQAYACEQVSLREICPGNLPACPCVGSAYSFQLSVTGGLAPFNFSIASGSLPTGLTLSSSGLISGTPTVPGIFQFSIRVSSSLGGFVVKNYQVSVLYISTSQLPAFTIGIPYSFQLTATGGSGNYKWKIVSGTLPSGLIMDNNGLISGTPT